MSEVPNRIPAGVSFYFHYFKDINSCQISCGRVFDRGWSSSREWVADRGGISEDCYGVVKRNRW